MTLLALQATAPALDGALIAGFVLFGIALVLLLLEFVVPSAGVIAGLCGACLVAGVACFFVHSALWGFAALAFSLGGAPFAIGWGLRIWSTTPLARRAVLSTELEVAPSAKTPRVGSSGRALTDLRPVGRVEIEGAVLEAIAEGGFVEAGRAVRVVAGAESGTIRVRAEARD